MINYAAAFTAADAILSKGDSVEILKEALETLTETAAGFIIPLDDKFFKLPASTKFHSTTAGGLFRHSYAVTKLLCSYTEDLGLQWQRPESPLIVGICHDLCKVEQYRFSGKGCYIYDDLTLMPDHGAQSVILAQQALHELTQEEIACIRWHMGAFEKDSAFWRYYTNAVKFYPNVLYTHTADMAATHIYNT